MKRYERWQVHGFQRPVMDFASDGEAFKTGANEDVVVVREGDREWHVTVERNTEGVPQITSLMLRGGVIDQKALRQVPLSYLTEAALGFVASMEAERDLGAPLHEALATAATSTVEVEDDPSKVEQVAELWKATERSVLVGGKRISRREAVAQRLHLSVWSIDKYVREARDLGLLPQATTGRKRRDHSA